jgi:hypothetical protein
VAVNSGNGTATSGREVVDDDRGVAVFDQTAHEMAAEESGAAGDEM